MTEIFPGSGLFFWLQVLYAVCEGNKLKVVSVCQLMKTLPCEKAWDRKFWVAVGTNMNSDSHNTTQFLPQPDVLLLVTNSYNEDYFMRVSDKGFLSQTKAIWEKSSSKHQQTKSIMKE